MPVKPASGPRKMENEPASPTSRIRARLPERHIDADGLLQRLNLCFVRGQWVGAGADYIDHAAGHQHRLTIQRPARGAENVTREERHLYDFGAIRPLPLGLVKGAKIP